MLRTGIHPSPTLAVLLITAHSIAIVCVLGYLPAWWLKGPLVAALAASATFHLRRDVSGRARNAVTAITVHDDGRCELETRDGGVLAGAVLGTTFVSSPLVVVNVRLDDGRRTSVVLLPDSAAAEDLRALRVWLRYRCPPAASADR